MKVEEMIWAQFRLRHARLYSEEYKSSLYWPFDLPKERVS